MTDAALKKLELLREANQLAQISTGRDSRDDRNDEMAAIFAKGVSVSFLAKVFRMAPQTIREKLARCEPLEGSGESGTKQKNYRYDLALAASYIVTPKLTPEQFLSAVKRADLPPAFQQQFWDAQLKRQKWEEQAGQLWRTEKVQEVLGTAFQSMKFTMQLWVDTLERETGLTDRQREVLIRLVDGLQQEVYDALVKMAESRQTGPMLGEVQVDGAIQVGRHAVKQSEADDLADLL
jgi:hypothetical protein